ncbi:MAG: SDR family NAD(P)-dependent oxidoreductase [Gemmatimonadota bacterium]
MIDLAGRKVLITGGSRGIGRAAALLFARAGADVAITYHRRQADAEAVVAGIEALGRRGYAAGGDLGDSTVAATVISDLIGRLGGLDSFVANHGIWPTDETALAAMGDARWRHTLAANLDGVFYTLRAAIPHISKGGQVVIVTSTAGQRGESFHADYAATKGALISVTKSLAIECAPDITVNSVAPGWVDTEMSWSALEGDARDRITATIPLQRIPPAEDLAGPILFLCSDLARHITGEILNVNGGSVLCG